jgi:hypothetical protein
VNQKKMIVGIAGAVVLFILTIAGVVYLFSRLKTQPQAKQRTLISELVYCNSHDLRPCIVSFSVDADGNMLVNLLIPASNYPDFYLTISNGVVENRYECQQVEDFPTNVYCTGAEMVPGEPLQFNIIALEDETILAEGNFAIIGLLLPNPEEEATGTALATGTYNPFGTPTPLLLDFLTPSPTLRITATRTPSYPNPTSYPNRTAYP